LTKNKSSKPQLRKKRPEGTEHVTGRYQATRGRPHK